MTESLQNNSTYIQVTGLGIGEETKSSTVEYLVRQFNAHTVLRSGGCQAGHHIVREDGTDQMFSHFGCGTFDRAKTHLKHMVINPVDLFEEGLELESKGVKNPFELITIAADCLSITPFHGAMSRLKEKSREVKKGTVGMGVGDAIKDYNEDQSFGITAGEFLLGREYVQTKVERIRQRKLEQARQILSSLTNTSESITHEIAILENESLVNATVDSFLLLADLVKIVDIDYTKSLLAQKGVIVGEPSHGALLHPQFGFVPHTTQIDPTSQDVLKTLQNISYGGRILRLGVSRSYMTRHGAGPLPSFNSDFSQTFQETHNSNDQINDWLGEFRNGHYDLLAMKYAIEVSGGRKSFNGLAISYMDKLADQSTWDVCVGYSYIGPQRNDLNLFFDVQGNTIRGIKKFNGATAQLQYEHQRELTELLQQCAPVLHTLKPTSQSLEDTFINFVESNLRLPVMITAYGPKAEDRKIRPAFQKLLEQ